MGTNYHLIKLYCYLSTAVASVVLATCYLISEGKFRSYPLDLSENTADGNYSRSSVYSKDDNNPNRWLRPNITKWNTYVDLKTMPFSNNRQLSLSAAVIVLRPPLTRRSLIGGDPTSLPVLFNGRRVSPNVRSVLDMIELDETMSLLNHCVREDTGCSGLNPSFVQQLLLSRKSKLYGVVEEVGPVDNRTNEMLGKNINSSRFCSHDTENVPYSKDLIPRPRVTVRIQHEHFPRYSTPNATTLVTQMTANRVNMLHEIVSTWNDPVVACIYTDRSLLLELIHKLTDLLTARGLEHIQLIFVVKNETLYPINWIRNLGIKYSITRTVFSLDIDFVPSKGLSEVILSHVSRFGLSAKQGLVIPAFEAQTANMHFPLSKSELWDYKQKQQVRTFHVGIAPGGHSASDHSRWWSSATPYSISNVSCYKGYEPYIVISKELPIYMPETLLDRFYNKISQFNQLCHRKYTFMVVPDAFVIHRSHTKSVFAANKSSKDTMHLRHCNYVAWQTFINYLIANE